MKKSLALLIALFMLHSAANAHVESDIPGTILEESELVIRGKNMTSEENPAQVKVLTGDGQLIDLIISKAKKRKVFVDMPIVRRDTKVNLLVSGGDVSKDNPEEFLMFILNKPDDIIALDVVSGDVVILPEDSASDVHAVSSDIVTEAEQPEIKKLPNVEEIGTPFGSTTILGTVFVPGDIFANVTGSAVNVSGSTQPAIRTLENLQQVGKSGVNTTFSGPILAGEGTFGALVSDSIRSGTLELTGGTITDTSGSISFDDENLSTNGSITVSSSNIGTLSFNNGSITDSGGSISFNDENLSTNGSLSVVGIDNNHASILNVSSIGLDSIFSDNGASITINLGSDVDDDFIVGNNYSLVVEGDNENVGIGTNAPVAKLDVAGGINGITLAADTMSISSGRIVDSTDSINFDNADLLTNGTLFTQNLIVTTGSWSANGLTIAGGSITDANGDISFDDENLFTNGDLVVDTTTFVVDVSTNGVGIGTNTPGFELDIVGQTNMTNVGDSSSLLINGGVNGYPFVSLTRSVDASSSIFLTAASQDPQIIMRDDATNDAWSAGLDDDNANSYSIAFQNIAGASPDVMNAGTRHFTIRSNGDVGIGTTVPVSELDVAGTINGVILIADSLTIANGSISDANDFIDFGNDVLQTTGNINGATLNGQTSVLAGNITIQDNQIFAGGDFINFGNDVLTTTGVINGGTLNGQTSVLAGNITIQDNQIFAGGDFINFGNDVLTTTGIINGGTLNGQTSVLAGNITIQDNQIFAGGDFINFGNDVLTTTGIINGGTLNGQTSVKAGNVTIQDNAIFAVDDFIDFGDDALITTGVINGGTLNGQTSVLGGNVTIQDNAIFAVDDFIDFGDDALITTGVINGGTLNGQTSVLGGNIVLSGNSITNSATGSISFGSENLSSSGSITAGTLTIASGSITDTSQDIDFGDEDLTTLGNINGATLNGETSVKAGNVTIQDNAIFAVDDFIDFGDDALITTGVINGGTLNGQTSVLGGNIVLSGNSITNSATGSISFGSENLSTSGNITAGTLTIAGGSITDTSTDIDFNDEDLTTTGNINGATLNGETSVKAGNVTIQDNAIFAVDDFIDFGDDALTTTGVINGGTLNGETSVRAGDILINAGSITNTGGAAIGFGSENLSTSGNITAGTLTIAGGSITDTSTDIDFNDEDLTTTGNINGATLNGETSVKAGNVTIQDNAIFAVDDFIDFGDDALTTTGVINGGTLNGETSVRAADILISAGSITNTGGATISFGSENLSTSGTITGVVTGNVLTGFSAGAGTITAADSILTAFNKIVGNINQHNGNVGAIFTTLNAATNGNTADTLVSRDGNGDITAGTITAATGFVGDLNGTASHALAVVNGSTFDMFGASTIDVADMNFIRLDDSVPAGPNEQLDTMTGGVVGQIVTILFVAEVDIGDNDTGTANTIDIDGTNETFYANDTLQLISDGNSWFEISRSENNI